MTVPTSGILILVPRHTLFLQSNKILTPPSLALHSLKQLFANGNRIKRVPEDLCTLPNLQVSPR